MCSMFTLLWCSSNRYDETKGKWVSPDSEEMDQAAKERVELINKREARELAAKKNAIFAV